MVWAKVQRGIVLDDGQSLITVDMPDTLEVKSHFEEIVKKRFQYRANLARTVADIARRLPPNPSQRYDVKALEEFRGDLQEARPESFIHHPDTRDMKPYQPCTSDGQPSTVAADAPMQEQEPQHQASSSDTHTSHVDRKAQNEDARLQRLTALMARLGEDQPQEHLQHPQQSAPAPSQGRVREVSHQGPHVSQSSSSTAAYEGPSYGSFQSSEPSHPTAFPASEQSQPVSVPASPPRDYPVKPDLVDLLRTPPREESVEPAYFPGQYARERALDSQVGMDASDGTDDLNEEGRQDDAIAHSSSRDTRNSGGVMDWVKNILPF